MVIFFKNFWLLHLKKVTLQQKNTLSVQRDTSAAHAT
jgi:hypothetical protein